MISDIWKEVTITENQNRNSGEYCDSVEKSMYYSTDSGPEPPDTTLPLSGEAIK